jgi:hypothetical protein
MALSFSVLRLPGPIRQSCASEARRHSCRASVRSATAYTSANLPATRRARNQARVCPRLATQQPGERHPAAGPQAETLHRLVGIVRAGRQMPAMKTDQWRERTAISLDQPTTGEARGAAAEVGGGRQLTPPRSSRRSCRRAWPRSGRWRRPRRRTSAASRRGAPCSRAPARAPRSRPTCRHAAARRFP